MPVSIDVEHILQTIDEACQNCQQRFTTPNNELTENIRELHCSSRVFSTSSILSNYEFLNETISLISLEYDWSNHVSIPSEKK